MSYSSANSLRFANEQRIGKKFAKTLSRALQQCNLLLIATESDEELPRTCIYFPKGW